MKFNPRREGKAELRYGGKDYCYFQTPDNLMTIFYSRERDAAVIKRRNYMGFLYVYKDELERKLIVTSNEFEYNLEVSESDWDEFWEYWEKKTTGIINENRENEHFLEMSQVSCENEKDNCFYRVFIYGSENIKFPHLHFYKTKEEFNSKTGGCISLISPTYSNHGKCNSVLTRSEIKEFIEWLKKPNKYILGVNNYVACCFLWNSNNTEGMISHKNMPDYNDLWRLKCE